MEWTELPVYKFYVFIIVVFYRRLHKILHKFLNGYDE